MLGADSKYAKNIKIGDVVIKRPNRHSYTDRDIALWKERRKLDKECSVENEVAMLNQCAFSEVKCVYSYHKFSVIIAVK